MADPVLPDDPVFPIGAAVKIDGRGKGIVLARKKSTDGDIFTVAIDGIDFEVDIRSERLSLENASEIQQTTITRPTRFENLSENDVSALIQDQKNKSTLKKTQYNIKLLTEFLSLNNETRQIHEIPPDQLCDYLCKFIASVRKPDGSNYEPVTLRGYLASFERHLKENNYGYSILHNLEFAKLKDVFQAKQKQLKSEGLGNQAHKSEAITDQEIEQLWLSNQLGCNTPECIINSLWFFNTVSFGLRGSHEHREMCWGDIKLCFDDSGHEYLEFQERQTKTRQGTNPRDVRAVKPKMWANLDNPDRCPVNIYKIYAARRPADYCKPTDPFYIATHSKQAAMRPGEQWFKRQPIGENKLTSIMKSMAKAAGLSDSKRLTNHSARKHLVQKLSENHVPANQIMQITGHRNIQSINNYSSISELQHKNISGILTSNNTPRPCPMPVYQQLNMAATSNTGTHRSTGSYTFHGGLNNMFAGNIFGGTFNINITSNTCENTPQENVKRRRVIIESDSE